MVFFTKKNTYSPKAIACVVHEIGKRQAQQDRWGLQIGETLSNDALAVVADGMGGLIHSDQVSQKLVDSFMEGYALGGNLSGKEQLFMLLKKAIDDVSEMMKESRYDSGSTLVGAIIKNQKLSWISVGDSRIYLWRSGGIIQLNRDHDFRRDLSSVILSSHVTFEDVEKNPQKDSLTSFIGVNFPRLIDYNENSIQLIKGDKVILMSDGIYRCLSEDELCELLKYPVKEVSGIIKNRIVCKDIEAQDNYTAIVIEI